MVLIILWRVFLLFCFPPFYVLMFKRLSLCSCHSVWVCVNAVWLALVSLFVFLLGCALLFHFVFWNCTSDHTILHPVSFNRARVLCSHITHRIIQWALIRKGKCFLCCVFSRKWMAENQLTVRLSPTNKCTKTLSIALDAHSHNRMAKYLHCLKCINWTHIC